MYVVDLGTARPVSVKCWATPHKAKVHSGSVLDAALPLLLSYMRIPFSGAHSGLKGIAFRLDPRSPSASFASVRRPEKIVRSWASSTDAFGFGRPQATVVLLHIVCLCLCLCM